MNWWADRVVRYDPDRENRPECCSRVTFMQNFHSPLPRGYVKINSPFRRTEFRKGYEWSIWILMTTTVEFILILGLRWSLNDSGADPSFAGEQAWRAREPSDNFACRLKNTVWFKRNCGNSVLQLPLHENSDGVAMERYKQFLRRCECLWASRQRANHCGNIFEAPSRLLLLCIQIVLLNLYEGRWRRCEW